MIELRRILIPTDFSPHARAALALGAEIARRFDASVLLLHAYPLPVITLPEGFVPVSAQALAEALTQMRSALDQQRAELKTHGVREVETLIVEGAAAAEIVRVAGERKMDLVVMGTHGRGAFAHALLGSVAERVVRKAPCPVLTTHADKEPAKA
jgi:nucleotide-binding universal stress UspA family protein